MADEKDPPAGAEGDPPAAGTEPKKGAGDGKGKGDPPAETVEETVRRVLAEVLPDFLGNGDDGAGDDDDAGGAGGVDAGGNPPSPANVEKMAERAVRVAMDKIRREEKDSGRLERIEKVLTEEAPAKFRLATRLVWGSDTKEKARR